VNLICAVLAGREAWFGEVEDALGKSFGPIDLASGVWPFDHTDYYADEMGAGLLRKIYSFEELIAPDNLVAAKHTTNRLEKEFATEHPDGPPRPVNLDPGYVAASKLVLATTKNYTHRLYLGGGIYGECTLRWHDGAFQPWEWTYPDYRTDEYRRFFARVRECYQGKLGKAGR
jgi:hypothetical protein